MFLWKAFILVLKYINGIKVPWQILHQNHINILKSVRKSILFHVFFTLLHAIMFGENYVGKRWKVIVYRCFQK